MSIDSTRKRLAVPLICLVSAAVGVLPWTAPAHTVSAQRCDQVLANGDFEAGSLGWTQSSAGGYDLISNYNPFAGVWGAYLAGVDGADDRLSKAIVLPPAALSITVRAWWSMATSETGGGFDWMVLSLLQPDGTLVAELARIDDSADPDVWDELVVDLTPYAGQSVRLQARAVTDGSNPTDFFMDDLTVTVCVATSTPASTATVTPTVTATPTAAPTVGVRYGYLPLVLATTPS